MNQSTEQKFSHVITRKFTFGKASITYTDDGAKRKAHLYCDGIRVFKWESDDKNKWIASALCDFAKQLRNSNNFNTQSNYQISCLIGYSMAERNVGRYWHEYNNPNEISAALATCQARSGRVFSVPGNALRNYDNNPQFAGRVAQKDNNQQPAIH